MVKSKLVNPIIFVTKLCFITISLVIIIGQSFFAQPQMDDFSWFYVKEVYVSGSFVDTQWYFYELVNGRIFATLISTLLMSKSVLKFYPFFVVFLNVSFFACLFIVFRFFASKKRVLDTLFITVAFLLFFLSFSEFPTPFFYWLTGNIVYQLSTILILASALFYLMYLKNTEKKILLILFVAAGSASVLLFEYSFVIILILSFIIYLLRYDGLTNKRKTLVTVLFAFILIALAFAFNLFAPGNTIKSVQYSAKENHNFLVSITQSFSFFLHLFSPRKIVYLLIWCVVLISFPFNIAPVKKSKIISLLFFGVAFFYFVAMNFIYFYKLGKPTPLRVDNFNLFWFFIFLSISIVFIQPFVEPIVAQSTNPLSRLLYSVVPLFAIIYLSSFTNRQIASDFFTGKSYGYKKQMTKRNEQIKSSSGTICFVPPIYNPPKSLEYVELPYDSLSENEFYSRQLAALHGKKWVFQLKK